LLTLIVVEFAAAYGTARVVAVIFWRRPARRPGSVSVSSISYVVAGFRSKMLPECLIDPRESLVVSRRNAPQRQACLIRSLPLLAVTHAHHAIQIIIAAIGQSIARLMTVDRATSGVPGVVASAASRAEATRPTTQTIQASHVKRLPGAG